MSTSFSLVVPPALFQDMYNLDISNAVERHSFKESSQKGAGIINYLSWSHAVKLFRIHFPGWEVDCEMDTDGSYVFYEKHGAGMFMKPYVFYRNSEGQIIRTRSIYFAILTSSGATAFPFTADGKPNLQVLNAQAINRNYYRALTKAIAFVTGIGLKLWSGEDLTEEIQDARLKLLNVHAQWLTLYKKTFGEDYNSTNVGDLSIESLKVEIKTLKMMIETKRDEEAKNSSKQLTSTEDTVMNAELVN